MRFFFASRHRIPFILNTHGSLLGYQKYLPSRLQRLPYRIYDWATLKRSAGKADAVVVSSQLEYSEAVQFGIDKNKLHLIAMGIDVDDYPMREKSSAEGELKILFVGRLARVRRVELLLQAVQRLSVPWRLTVVGGEAKTSSLSKPGYLNELKKLCAELGIGNRVRFAGPQPQKDLKSFYREADVFVYPSLYENFAQPLLEAAASGLPVIATAVGIANEIIIDGETGYVVPGDPKAICERLGQMADASARVEMGRNIRKRVRENFAWDQVMDRYLELYRSF